jgi:ABC-2 type transport system permease protein
MRNILLVVKHEIVSTLGRRSFWVMVFLFPALILALSVGTQVMAQRSFEQEEESSLPGDDAAAVQAIGYVDEAGLIAQLPRGKAPERLRAFPDQAAAQAALEAGELEQYYRIPADFVETGDLVMVSARFTPLSSLAGGDYLFRYTLNYNLVKDERLTTVLMDPTPLVENRPLAPQGGTDTSSPLSFWVPYVTMFIFFFVITMSGGFMLQSVSKEKESRIVEVLLLSLRPRELMLGKVLGLGVVALLQMSVWGGVSLLGLSQRTLLTETAGAFALPPGFLAWGVLYFLLGYLLYASALGAIGALAPTAREGAQFTFIIMLPLMIPLWLNNVFTQTPNGGLATFLSLFPLTAPTSMVTRLMAGGVPVWQPAVGLVGLAATTYVFVLLSARFFRADTLLSSASLQWRRIVREFKR